MNTEHVKSKKIIATTLLISLLSACGGGGDGNNEPSKPDNTPKDPSTPIEEPSTPNESDKNIHANVAQKFVDNLATPAFNKFADDSKELPQAINSYCSNISSNVSSSERTNAQESWLALENQWQATKLYHVGVLAENNGVLTKNIYTNNYLNQASIQAINAQVQEYKTNKNLEINSATPFNVRGLDTLEYLLFDQSANNKDSCNYAELVAKNISTDAQNLAKSWVDGRNDLLTNKQSNAVDLIQPFFDNVITLLDKEIKDASLGTPLAVKIDGSCQSICSDKVEHHISKTSYQSIKANLVNIKSTFTGNGDAGFKQYYDNNKMSQEATAFVAKIDNAIATINAQNSSLFDQLNNITTSGKDNSCATVATTGDTSDQDLAPCKLYYQIKQISDDVKTGSFKLAINLDLPAAAAGDGD